jgi:hypothetical protein
MMSDVHPAWIVFCEASSDAEISTWLADRVIQEKISWALDTLEYIRSWRGFESDREHTTWKAVRHLAIEHGIKVHGDFGGGHRKGAYVEAHKALSLVHENFVDAKAVLLVRDTDGELDRREGFEAARKNDDWPFAIVLALPHPEREAWVLNGFEPQDDAENQRLADERQQLGFDPRKHAEELNPGSEFDPNGTPIKRSTKRILKALTNGAFDRERQCWTETDLHVLRSRGQQTGLTEFLREVEDRLVPLISRG